MNKISLLSLMLAVSACTSPTAPTQTGRLSAGPDAQHAGVYAYAVDGDVVTLFDQDGIETGRVAMSSPTADRRVFTVEYTDGTLDDAEVYRPMHDGRFVAPVTPETALTAALADPALAPLWATQQVRFTVNLMPRLGSGQRLGLNDKTTTTPCSSPSSDTPAGCARPANTAAGCTNPSQLPAVITYTTGKLNNDGTSFLTLSECQANVVSVCSSDFGGGDGDDWNANTTACLFDGSEYWVRCWTGTSGNSWTASCPRLSCGTVGQYDAVPRLRDCTNPGSCTKSQGTVGCTPYH